MLLSVILATTFLALNDAGVTALITACSAIVVTSITTIGLVMSSRTKTQLAHAATENKEGGEFIVAMLSKVHDDVLDLKYKLNEHLGWHQGNQAKQEEQKK